MVDQDNLEYRVAKIELRNRNVELHKTWEGSWTRKILLIIFTYVSIALYLKFIVGIEPWRNALVPSLGFLLSTLTLPWFKSWWVRFIYKK